MNPENEQNTNLNPEPETPAPTPQQPPTDNNQTSHEVAQNNQHPLKNISIFGISGMWLLLIGIFLFGMFVAPTEEAVNAVHNVYFLVGIFVFVSSVGGSVHRVRKNLDSPYSGGSYSSSHKPLIAFLIGLFLLVTILPIGVLYMVFILTDWASKSSQRSGKKITGWKRGLLIFFTAAMTFFSVGIGILIGSFALGLRACELSSSKCL